MRPFRDVTDVHEVWPFTAFRAGHAVLKRGIRACWTIGRRTTEGMARLVQPRGLILIYHRIAQGGSDPWMLNVSPSHFAEHLEVLRRHLQPLTLSALARARAAGRVPRGSVVVTFDDGYADNLHDAAPVLARYGVPATVFVTRGGVDARRGFWWDELEAIVLRTVRLPVSLDLSVGEGRRWSWRAADGPAAGSAAVARADRPQLYFRLWGVLRELDARQREQALDQLRGWAAGAAAVPPPVHRPLTAQELAALAEHPLIDIGAHTVNHPDLTALSRHAQREEIQAGKAHIQRIIGLPVAHFAYPHGAYTPDTVADVRDAGYASACTSRQAVVVRTSDPYELPRVPILDWDGERFARELSQWLPFRQVRRHGSSGHASPSRGGAGR